MHTLETSNKKVAPNKGSGKINGCHGYLMTSE